MSKSLGNFITLKDAIIKYSPAILKIIYLSSHYRSPLDFSQSRVQEAKRVKERIVTFIKQLDSRSKGESMSDYRSIDKEAFSYREIKELYDKFIGFMDDDFNMPGGFSVIFDVMRFANNNMDKEDAFFYEVKKIIYFILSVLSLEEMFNEALEGKAVFPSIDKDFIEEEITRRNKLRKEHKFKEADEIRTKLMNKGVILEDQPGGKTIWYRK